MLSYHGSHFISSFPCDWRSLGLPAFPRGYGIENKVESSYSWTGAQRGDLEFVIFQYTLSGMGMLEYKQNCFELIPGRAMLVTNPGPYRYWLPYGFSNWEFAFITMGGPAIYQLCSNLISHSGPVISFDDDSDIIAKFMTFIIQAHKDPGNVYDASSFVYKLCTDLHKIHNSSANAESNMPVSISKAIQYCKQHYKDAIGVDDLAEQAALSRYYFSHLFKKHIGMSPGEYLIKIRLQKATEMLANKRFRVKDVAGECGFPDVNYFCRIYRKRFGISPGNVKKQGVY